MGSTGRQALKWTAGLIALYLGVNYYYGLTHDVSSVSSGSVNVIKSLQGR